jgi:hypothetical protein
MIDISTFFYHTIAITRPAREARTEPPSRYLHLDWHNSPSFRLLQALKRLFFFFYFLHGGKQKLTQERPVIQVFMIQSPLSTGYRDLG